MSTVRVVVQFFAQLREIVGKKSDEIDLDSEATVSDLWEALIMRYPSLADAGRFRVAINHEYADEQQVLADRDEVAIIPPVSGGSGLFTISQRPIELESVFRAVADPGAGATVVFQGTTRDENGGRSVAGLEYEAYREMAETQMRAIGEEIKRRWKVTRVAMVHRIGRVAVGEASVAIAVSAAHRKAAFEACRYGIDALKTAVPIWKKEHYRDGSRWIG